MAQRISIFFKIFKHPKYTAMSNIPQYYLLIAVICTFTIDTNKGILYLSKWEKQSPRFFKWVFVRLWAVETSKRAVVRYISYRIRQK